MVKLLICLATLLFFYQGIINAQITNGCNTAGKACYYFSNCAETSNPSNENIATIYTTGDNAVQFQMQYSNAAIGWIAIGFSETNNMPNTYIFLCHRTGSAGVNIQERFASARALPPISSTQLLTAVSYANSGSILNCTFTSPVTRTPMLNNPQGYWILLARGAYTSGNIVYHGSNRCVSSSRPVITTAVGSGSTTIIPAVRFIYAMLALLFASYAFL